MTLPLHRVTSGVALTFDDGPDPVHTPLLLDALLEEGVRASFFVTVSEAVRFPHLVKRVVEEGHTLAGHGWNHLSLPSRPELWVDEVVTASAVLSDLAGVPVTLFRPPYGDTSEEFLEWCASEGFVTVLWSLEGGDWEAVPPAVVHDNVARDMADGDVVLLHDGRKGHLRTAEVARLLAASCRERSLDLVPL